MSLGLAELRTHSHPRTALVWRVLESELVARGARIDGVSGERLRVVDAGGGTGGFAVPFAEMGHAVTVVDPSPDALASLARRAADRGVRERITAIQGDADQLLLAVEPDSADLVLCHSVFEFVDDPGATIRVVTRLLRPGGAVSVLVANRTAAVFTHALAGDVEAAYRILEANQPEGRSPRGSSGASSSSEGVEASDGRYFDLESAYHLLRDAGLEVEQVHGIGVFADVVPGVASLGSDAGEREHSTPLRWGGSSRAAARLLELEEAVATQSPYRDIASQLHLLGRRGTP